MPVPRTRRDDRSSGGRGSAAAGRRGRGRVVGVRVRVERLWTVLRRLGRRRARRRLRQRRVCGERQKQWSGITRWRLVRRGPLRLIQFVLHPRHGVVQPTCRRRQVRRRLRLRVGEDGAVTGADGAAGGGVQRRHRSSVLSFHAALRGGLSRRQRQRVRPRLASRGGRRGRRAPSSEPEEALRRWQRGVEWAARRW